MGHKHDREAGALQFAKKSKNGIARAGVQCAGRFVGQEKVGTVDDRPRDGNTLLLTSRKEAATDVEALAELGEQEQRIRAQVERQKAS